MANSAPEWSGPGLEGVERTMRRALEPPDASVAQLYGWLSYHVGYTSIDGRVDDGRRGKGVRPSLCLAACAAVGGSKLSAEQAAAAIELTHEFSLIHDDLQDRDRVRRGRPALWTEIGDAQAIGAGDTLFSIARHVLASIEGIETEVRLDINTQYDRACIRLSEGQFLDLVFEGRDDVGVDEYFGMVERKTGALLGAAAGIGARLGGADAASVDALTDAGEAIGVAFQVRDDVLGLWGSAGLIGKPAGNDLRRGKKSLPIVFALNEPSAGNAIRRFWAAGAPESEADSVLEHIEAAGAKHFAEGEAARYVDLAVAALNRVPLDPGETQILVDLAHAAISRRS